MRKSQCPLNGSNPFRDTRFKWDPNVPKPQCTDETELAYLVLPSSDFSTLEDCKGNSQFLTSALERKISPRLGNFKLSLPLPEFILPGWFRDLMKEISLH